MAEPEIAYPAQIVGAISDLLRRVKQLEQNLRVSEQLADLEGAEPDSDLAPSSPAFHPYYYYTVRVDSVVDASALFLGTILTATSATSKWTPSRDITMVVTVDVPSNISLPEAGDIVVAHYSGNYAAGKARFILAGGGGNDRLRCVVTSFADNQLTVAELAEGTSTQVGTPMQAWLPHDLQRQSWDTQTLNGVAYTYSSAQNRVASQSSITELHRIIPLYYVGCVVYVGRVKNSPGVSSDKTAFMDLNMSGRAWSKVSS